MEKGIIIRLSLDELKAVSTAIDYADNDILVTKNVDNIPSLHNIVRLNFLLLVACLDGDLQMEINGASYQLHTGDMAICLPTMLIGSIKPGKKHKVNAIGFSTGFLRRILKYGRSNENLLSILYRNPILHTQDINAPSYFDHYKALIQAKIEEEPSQHHTDILQHLFSALLYEILTVIHRTNDTVSEQEKIETGTKRMNYVFRRFLLELSKDNGLHRSVSYFAGRLCYSAKYMSTMVKQASGRTATEWINETVIELIKHELKFSDKSIKEIAEQFHFPNQSFFGKYVKAHIGMSPARYRDAAEK